MKNIKFLKNKFISLNNREYKPYLIGGFNEKFDFIHDEDKEQDGITQWFNYKGLTYVPKNL